MMNLNVTEEHFNTSSLGKKNDTGVSQTWPFLENAITPSFIEETIPFFLRL